MANGLSKLWARVTGLKEWDREVTSLHNVIGDDTPPTGAVRGASIPNHSQDQEPLSKQERIDRYETWEGEDPGH